MHVPQLDSLLDIPQQSLIQIAKEAGIGGKVLMSVNSAQKAQAAAHRGEMVFQGREPDLCYSGYRTPGLTGPEASRLFTFPWRSRLYTIAAHHDGTANLYSMNKESMDLKWIPIVFQLPTSFPAIGKPGPCYSTRSLLGRSRPTVAAIFFETRRAVKKSVISDTKAIWKLLHNISQPGFKLIPWWATHSAKNTDLDALAELAVDLADFIKLTGNFDRTLSVQIYGRSILPSGDLSPMKINVLTSTLERFPAAEKLISWASRYLDEDDFPMPKLNQIAQENGQPSLLVSSSGCLDTSAASAHQKIEAIHKITSKRDIASKER